jgi:hypothetical protein
LLIVCFRMRTIVGIVTGFTVAHSITLGLAATNTLNRMSLQSHLFSCPFPFPAAAPCWRCRLFSP